MIIVKYEIECTGSDCTLRVDSSYDRDEIKYLFSEHIKHGSCCVSSIVLVTKIINKPIMRSVLQTYDRNVNKLMDLNCGVLNEI